MVFAGADPLGTGHGATKQEAEQEAARAALQTLVGGTEAPAASKPARTPRPRQRRAPRPRDGALRTARNEPLPKGLSDTTLDLIVQALSQSQSGLAAAAVADAAGVSRVTARRYLDHLCQLGRAELTMRYGGPGRPEHRYQLNAAYAPLPDPLP